jgi:NAD-dependent isocitrate dehydrogenase
MLEHPAIRTEGGRPTSPVTTVTLIAGDGIGPEIALAVKQVFAAAGAPITWDEQQAGLNSLDVAPNGLPAATLESIKRHRVALKGPTATPSGGGHKSVNVTIRKSLELYANVRPVKSMPGVESRYQDVDLVIVRENLEDTYGGIEHMQTPDVAQGLKLITRPGSLAICRYAFELARAWGRKRLSCVQKSNIHKMTDGLFLECFREVAKDYPDLAADEVLVDAACMNLVIDPTRFDVMVMPNLYGDILSDLCAGLIGGLGMAPAGNIGHGVAVFEAVHGTAPDIAGMGLANPSALLLSATQMLRHLGHHSHAARIETALVRALESGVRTRDLRGAASTQAFVEAIIAHLPEADEEVSVLVRQDVAAAPAVASSCGTDTWELMGADVFVQCDALPELPKRVGPFELKVVSNRGTKVYPGPVPDILLVDCHRCRYVSEGPVTDIELLGLLEELSKGHTWMHVEKLRVTADGKPCYGKAQGE